METRPFLHLLSGKIASGKSTFAARLAVEANAILVSEDHFLATLYRGEITTIEDYARQARRFREAIGPHLVELLRVGLSIVLDFPANTRDQRAWMRELIDASGASHRLHYLRASDDLCRQRLLGRNAGGRHQYRVDEDTFTAFNSHFVAPEPAEGFEIVIHDQR